MAMAVKALVSRMRKNVPSPHRIQLMATSDRFICVYSLSRYPSALIS